MKITFLSALIVIAFTACSKPAAPPTVVVRPALTQVVGSMALQGSHSYSGDIRARYEVAMGFRVGGKITKRLVDAGAVVKVGQVLAELDSADEGLQVGATEAQYQLAKADAERYRMLRSKNFVSQSALDAKEATLKSLTAQADLARNQSAYTKLVADKAGVVTDTLAEAGQVVSAGQAIVKLALDGDREAAVAIPESQFSALKVGMKADVTLLGDGNENYHQVGRLRELSPAADPASGTYAARISLPDTKVPLGMTAKVRFADKSAASDALIIPLTAVFQQGDKAAVWIVAADNSVSLHPIQIAKYVDEGALIRAGLQGGERIITNGVHMLHAGEKIQPIESGAVQ